MSEYTQRLTAEPCADKEDESRQMTALHRLPQEHRIMLTHRADAWGD